MSVTPQPALSSLVLRAIGVSTGTVVSRAGIHDAHEAAGTSAGLSGALGIVFGAVFAVWSGAVFKGDFAPVANIIAISASLTFLRWLLVRKRASIDAYEAEVHSR
ncbi:hypothetical protein [Chromatocurvus halotolerans]|uniref:Uncharacterized protein n=1 Tax=Chromatocurvus halotolerans TaxID=1132028 RepID=A0A4R2KUR6_9GAMM|nr:hypothetical protein [Chromatocurvus halotolerans]TCO77563.1 hypothetical protein EV688_10220 [Chromatocurvus halotolerans]